MAQADVHSLSNVAGEDGIKIMLFSMSLEVFFQKSSTER